MWVNSSITPWGVHRTWGDLLYDKRAFRSAELEFKAALKEAPFLIEAHDGYVRSLKEQGKLQEALKAAKDAIELNPSMPGAYYVYTHYLISIQHEDEAIKEFDIIASRFPWTGEPLVAKGEQLMSAGKVDAAVQAFALGLQREPDNPSLYLRYASALSGNGKFSQAVEVYNQMLRSEPASVDTLLGKADVLIMQEKLDEAEQLVQKAIFTGVSSSWGYEYWGAILVAKGAYLKGIQEYDEAIAHDPTRLNSYLAKAYAAEYPLSVETLKRAVSLGLESSSLRRSLGFEKCRSNDAAAVREAPIEFEQAAASAPNDAEILFEYADCLRQNGDRSESDDKLKRALELDPLYLPFYGYAQRAPRNYKAIQLAINSLYQFSPADPKIKSQVDARIARLQEMLSSRFE